jgi:hypothetical protein
VRRHWPAAIALAVLGVVIGLGVTSGESAGLVVVGIFALLAVMAHFWFVEWGPHATPNRLYRRELWRNRREVHRELRHHRREVQKRLTPPHE